jgi:hypothetical protein
MKTLVYLSCFLVLICLSCNKDSNKTLTSTSSNDAKTNINDEKKGFEIYLSQTAKSYNETVNYSSLRLDTIRLENQPIISYDDIISVDTINYIINLKFSHDSISFKNVGVHGRLFIATLDSQPVFCGFLWVNISSIPCSWITMMEPYKPLDSLQENQIKIRPGVSSPNLILNRKMIDRLLQDGKIAK